MPEPPVYPVQAAVDNEIAHPVEGDAGARRITRPCRSPPLVGYEPDPSVLGSPFFVMGFVGGEIPREDPNYVVEGFYVGARAPTSVPG
ncbi:MAG: hypothetical protein R2695_08975 [Acidimicrobiales bacterium]